MTISPRLRAWLLLGVALVALAVAVLGSRGGDSDREAGSPNGTRPAATSTSAADRDAVPATTAPKPGPATGTGGAPPTAASLSRVPGVPDRAYRTLVEIDAGRWPDSANAPGTHGGDTYFNRSRALPAKDAAGNSITYREWDVNPKQRGRGRDAERIVTGSDGSAYYTGDHYDTFTRMR
ncbi:ribonuclease [Nocardia otitidiscaviarum]|uniref:ribonuclease domain-containing protein n=1 Tax=Nocardia otitidiscaviarum TaxID=1823 RepID=UPI0004A71C12|nr:ribonuclease domain-containing protein [Nocardia otitidiscaviarum]MBF6133671.1 ribonuclease [Nocardia otitidiscaviarum]